MKEVGQIKKNMSLKLIDKKIESCNSCILRNSVDVNKKFGPTYGYGGNFILLCGLAPSYKRLGSKRPLSRDKENRTAKILFDVFDEIEWPVDKTYFTNLLKCSLPENRLPTNEEVDSCFNLWLIQEIILVNPFAIVSMGKFVTNYLKSKDISEYIPIYSIEHFSYINRRQDLKDIWKKKWIEIKSNIENNIKEIKD